MSAQKVTSSAVKLRTWEATRALDRRALELLREDGHTLASAYKQAMDEQQIAFRGPLSPPVASRAE